MKSGKAKEIGAPGVALAMPGVQLQLQPSKALLMAVLIRKLASSRQSREGEKRSM